MSITNKGKTGAHWMWKNKFRKCSQSQSAAHWQRNTLTNCASPMWVQRLLLNPAVLVCAFSRLFSLMCRSWTSRLFELNERWEPFSFFLLFSELIQDTITPHWSVTCNWLHTHALTKYCVVSVTNQSTMECVNRRGAEAISTVAGQRKTKWQSVKDFYKA